MAYAKAAYAAAARFLLRVISLHSYWWLHRSAVIRRTRTNGDLLRWFACLNIMIPLIFSLSLSVEDIPFIPKESATLLGQEDRLPRRTWIERMRNRSLV